MTHAPSKPYLNLLSTAEGHLLSDAEINSLIQVAPEEKSGLEAARSLSACGKEVVTEIAQEMTRRYGLAAYDELATDKTVRDMLYVLAYVQHAALRHDSRWLDDRMLIWLKTILRSFQFPDLHDRDGVKENLINALAKLPPGARCIYHSYWRLEEMIRDLLTEDHYRVIGPYLEQVRATLMEDYAS